MSLYILFFEGFPMWTFSLCSINNHCSMQSSCFWTLLKLQEIIMIRKLCQLFANRALGIRYSLYICKHFLAYQQQTSKANKTITLCPNIIFTQHSRINQNLYYLSLFNFYFVFCILFILIIKQRMQCCQFWRILEERKLIMLHFPISVIFTQEQEKDYEKGENVGYFFYNITYCKTANQIVQGDC